jgi:type IV pilus assembly protein PilA
MGSSSSGVTAAYASPSLGMLPRYVPPCILASQPGSSDDVIRAQVSEGLALAAAAQAAVADFFSDNGEAPVNRSVAGMTAVATDTSGNYVTSVYVGNGTVTITYGNEAHREIRGETLSLTPYESIDLSVAWRCGLADIPAGTALMGTSGFGVTAAYVAPSSGMLSRYMPFACRP